MAFSLLTNNLTTTSIIDQPGGVAASADNFITSYDYAEKYMPELVPQLYLANGKGKISWLLKLIGAESTYASDQIEWAERGRLQNILKNVALTTNTFTSPTAHALRVGDTIKISDGVADEAQATVTSITSSTVFVATNDAGGSFPTFAGNVDIICDFSNSFDKGSEAFTEGKRWEPTPKYNYTHILKEYYAISGSDMVHKSWIMTPDGPKWFNHEIENTNILFDNKIELTQIFHERKASGTAKGVIGVVPQIEAGGNLGNQYITTIDDLSGIAYRAKQQGTCREFTIFHNHQQGAYLREMMSGVNAHYAAGANYGLFNNSMDMSLMLGFKSVYIDGVTFHFTPWSLLDQPELMGNAKFKATNLACLIVPSGNNYVQENGNTVSKPYLSTRFRADGSLNRKRVIDIYGPGGTPQTKDVQSTTFLSEFTNQLVGANNFFAVRTGDFYA
jgi:hypothetical protein